MPPNENDDYYESISGLEATEFRMKIMNRPPPPIPTIPIVREPMIQTPEDHRSDSSYNEDFVFLFKPQSKTLRRGPRNYLKLLIVFVFVISLLCVSAFITLFSLIFLFNDGLCWESRLEPDQNNSRVYYECSGILWKKRSCKWADEYYDKDLKTCKIHENCVELSAHHIEGRKYKKCRGNKWVEEECPIDRTFDTYFRQCVKPRQKVKCIKNHTRNNVGNRFETCDGEKYVWQECTGDCPVPLCTNGAIEKVPQIDHRMYKVCENGGFQWSYRNCPGGYVFNETVHPKKCLPKYY